MQFPDTFANGRIVRGRSVGGLTLAEVDYTSGQQILRHAHDHARFVLVLRGALEDTCIARTRRCEASTLIFRPAGEPHENAVAEGGASCLIVDMAADWMARAREGSDIISDLAEFRGGMLCHLAGRLYGEFRLRDEVSRLMIESITLGMLADASRRHIRSAQAHPPRWLRQVRDLLHAQFANRLMLVEIAGAVGVHPVHLARAFRLHYRCTIGDYVRQLRLEFACSEMSRSSAPLAEIAAAAGFSDQSHLTRLFKRHTGLTPAEYRHNVRR